MTVDVEVHAGEVHLDDARTEVSHLTDRVSLDGSLRVLHHDHAVLVIGIRDGESRLWQTVEESLLCIAVVLKRLVIIEVVACEVREDATGKLQSADTLLMNGVRGALHEGVLASGFHHLAEKLIEFNRVRGGVVSWNRLAVDIVAHCRHQSAAITELAEHII